MFGAVFRVALLLSLALLLPRFLLLYAPQQQIFFSRLLGAENKALLGVSSFNELIKQSNLGLSGKKVLLVTNHQAYDKTTNHYLKMLAGYGVKPNLIYRSRNGLINTNKINLEGPSLNLPKISMSGVDHLTGRDLQKIDLILVDLQNSGLVPDNALSDLIEIMQLAQAVNKQLILLDRPNPLGSLQEGPLVNALDHKLKFKLPLRYGLTLGELAGYANHELFNNKIKLIILPLRHYTRNNFNDKAFLQLVEPYLIYRPWPIKVLF